MGLSSEQSLDLLHRENESLKIAREEVERARNEHQELSAFWYSSANVAGAFVHMSNPIEVRQSLNKCTGPAKGFVHNYIPDNEPIMSVLDKIRQGTFSLPLISQNITSIDATVAWPVPTGGKRIYANRIGKTMVSITEVNRSQMDANQQSLLIETYFGFRLRQSAADVKTEVHNSLKIHYGQTLKLEQGGTINRAECLFTQVSMDGAKRELKSVRKDLTAAQQAFKNLINMEGGSDIRTAILLLINEAFPPAQYFKDLAPVDNYIVNQLELQQVVADDQLKIGRPAYVPNIALFGRQTLHVDGLDKYLSPRTMVGAGFTWDIFGGLNREKTIRQAKIASQSLHLGREKVIMDPEVGIDKLYSQLQNALDNVKALDTTIEISRELARVRRKSFQEGVAAPTEIVDAGVMLAKVETTSLLVCY